MVTRVTHGKQAFPWLTEEKSWDGAGQHRRVCAGQCGAWGPWGHGVAGGVGSQPHCTQAVRVLGAGGTNGAPQGMASPLGVLRAQAWCAAVWLLVVEGTCCSLP